MSTEKEKTTFRCSNCNGEVRFDVQAQGFLCVACRTPYTPQTETAVVLEKDFEQQKMLVSSAELSGVKVARCDGCGGEIFFSDNETAARCPMCGSAKLRENLSAAVIKPDGIVPFRVDRHQAQVGFREYVTKRFFAPGNLKKAYEEGKLEGWYIPFWTFDAQGVGDYSAEGGKSVKVKKEGRDVTETRWFPVRGRVQKLFDDVLVCATNSASKDMTDRIDAFNTQTGAVPYSPQYLQGYLAEYRSVEAAEAFQTAQKNMTQQLEAEARKEVLKVYSKVQNLQLKAYFNRITCKNLLLPVYRASYAYGGKVYDYIINGQTGKVSAKYPKSAIKIVLVILAVVAVIAGIVLLTKLG